MNAKKKTKTKAAPVAKAGETKKLTAAQRLEALETLVVQQNQKFDILADEIDKSRNLIASLAKRLNAAIQAGENGSISQDSVNKLILDDNINELKGKVDNLIKADVLKRDDELEIVDKTFVVGQEVDEDGTVVNPRVQFAVGSLPQDFKDKLLGKKVGDLIKPEEGLALSLEITEVYAIVTPQQDKKFEEEDAATEEPAPEEPGTKTS